MRFRPSCRKTSELSVRSVGSTPDRPAGILLAFRVAASYVGLAFESPDEHGRFARRGDNKRGSRRAGRHDINGVRDQWKRSRCPRFDGDAVQFIASHCEIPGRVLQTAAKRYERNACRATSWRLLHAAPAVWNRASAPKCAIGSSESHPN